MNPWTPAWWQAKADEWFSLALIAEEAGQMEVAAKRFATACEYAENVTLFYARD